MNLLDTALIENNDDVIEIAAEVTETTTTTIESTTTQSPLTPAMQQVLADVQKQHEEFQKYNHEKEIMFQNCLMADNETRKIQEWYSKFQFTEPAFYCSDTGKVKKINEVFFAHAYTTFHQVIYDPSRKSLFQYRAAIGCWEPISELSLEQQIRQMIEDCAKSENNNEIRIKNNHAAQTAVVRTIKSLCEHSGQFSQEKHDLSFQCRNGVLFFDQARKTWDFQTFSAKNYNLTGSKIIYRSSAQCPKFHTMLLEPALNAEDIEMLQMYFGQCLLGRNLSQTALLLTGNAGCGKSVIVSVLEKLIGEDNVTQLRESSCHSRFENAAYLNKHLLSAKDVPFDFLSSGSASKIKALTGDDGMNAEMKYRNSRIHFRGQFNVIITANGTLKIKLENDRDAWKRRLLWIRFNGTMPEKQITDFATQLIEEEGSGILNWAMEGAEKLAQAEFKFPRTEQQLQRIDDLLNDCDSLLVFSDKTLVADDESDSTIRELEPCYQAFCDEQGLIALPSKEFRAKLSDIMERVYHKSLRHDIKRGETQVRGFKGIKCTWNAK